jgi:hypothetical protein
MRLPTLFAAANHRLRLLLTMVVSGDEDDQGGHKGGCRKPLQALSHDHYGCVRAERHGDHRQGEKGNCGLKKYLRPVARWPSLAPNMMKPETKSAYITIAVPTVVGGVLNSRRSRP